MARNRVIYQSDALYVSENLLSTASGKHRQLDRVQSANYNFAINRQDINQYGQLARIDSVVLDTPTVNLDFSYYLTDGSNERALGFNVLTGVGGTTGSFLSGMMTEVSGDNMYVITSSEGLDANLVTNSTGDNIKSVIGFGNVFVTDYTLDVAVGSLPTVSVTAEASNINATLSGIVRNSGASGTIVNSGVGTFSPAVNPSGGLPYTGTFVILPSGTNNTGANTVSALRYGDVTLSLGTINSGILSDISAGLDGIHIQSASLSVPLARTPLQRLGSKFPYARLVDFPLNVTLNVSAILNEVTAENLATTIDTNPTVDITLAIKKPGISDNANAMVYVLKGAKLDSESISSSIGSNKTVDLVFSTQIGGTNDTVNGLFVSGFGTGNVFQ
jgi:hypothetical protein